MPIHPLPQFEADLAEHDREVYERLKPPSSVVVRFGLMKMVGEFPYSGEAKPGCGSKLVVKTHRGTELGEMLTSTCPNAGCSKSVTRQEMLEYIENSGGREYPFFSMQGRVLRIATAEDLNEQARLEAMRPEIVRSTRMIAQRMNITDMKVVDAEPILGGERLTIYFTSEDRVDFRDLVNELAAMHHTRIEMRQVGARDEARLVADYERCGQHCCCKQFLKVLKPVSMKSAKIQKATLDPLKISGRCGRLMCCLRYEDETYDQLRARLPKKKTRVRTPDGWGTVLDSQILTQLVLVQMDATGEQVAIVVEELEPAGPNNPAPPIPPPGPSPGARDGPARGGESPEARAPGTGGRAPQPVGEPGPRPARGPSAPPPAPKKPAPRDEPGDDEVIDLDDIETDVGDGPPMTRRERPDRRDRSRGGGGGGGGSGGGQPGRAPQPGGDRHGPPGARPGEAGGEGGSGPGGAGGGKRRRRRRRRGPGGEPGQGDGAGGGGSGGGGGGGGGAGGGEGGGAGGEG